MDFTDYCIAAILFFVERSKYFPTLLSTYPVIKKWKGTCPYLIFSCIVLLEKLWTNIWLYSDVGYGCFVLVQWLFCFHHFYILGYAEHINNDTNQKLFSPKWCGCRDLLNEVSSVWMRKHSVPLWKYPKTYPLCFPHNQDITTVGYLRSWKYFSRICRRRSTGSGCIWFWASIKLRTVARIYRARVVCHTVYISLKSLASVVSNHIACFSLFSGNNL